MYLLPLWLWGNLFKFLLFWTPFDEMSRESLKCNQVIFFIVQTLLIFGVVLFSSIRYQFALWKPPAVKHSAWLVFLAAFPALLYYVFRAVWLFVILAKAASIPNAQIYQIHYALWSDLPYGASLEGVFFSSIMLIFGPVFEEIIFTGFLLNFFLKRYNLLSAIVSIPILFTVAHIPQQGLGVHLISIFVSGLAFVFVRLVSGKLSYSVMCHMFINVIFSFSAMD